MRFFLVLALTLAAITGCSEQPSSPQSTIEQSGGQCHKDTDCKGDRICDGGTCKAPKNSIVQEPSTAPVQAQSLTPQTHILSLEEIDKSAKSRGYAELRTILRQAGYSPDGTVDKSVFSMDVAGDPAQCGNAGCSIPWSGNGRTFCVGVSVNDNLKETQWEAGLIHGSAQNSALASGCE